MDDLATIYARAVARKGGEAALEAELPPKGTAPDQLSRLGDDRILSEMTRKVFQAGFSWSVIDAKWDGFERAFWGFDPARCAMMSDEDIDALLQETGIVRHGAKIVSVRDNAVFLQRLAADHGSAARAIGGWPVTDQIGLMALLKEQGARLGGTTGLYALRVLGKDCFILTKSVVAALNDAGVIAGAATSKKAQAAIQAAFNGWMAETGDGLTRLSRILALSTPE